jgi:hypothetical protein
LQRSLIKINASAAAAIPLLQQNLLMVNNRMNGYWRITNPFTTIFSKLA